MLAGFVRLWNRLGIGQMPWYSSDDLRQAENIQRAVQQGKVPSNQLEQALTQMLRTYPLDLSLYVTAADFCPNEKPIYSARLPSMALICMPENSGLRKLL